ncbi:hypothetical protein I547_7506 [Mycobacterium kansasii 824]|uniref:Uncharacterized protein n=1 Tax=Mycobacterium kansasii TaxID=1768 RepID=A0A1V3XAC3_MYCKA|nr:hypothetical protein I547_7506 [Mycobacterium kansasii 824]OOK72630.1 hypothetical protein BZL29_4956 [Mycobacterium kansasii]OOK76087.1 hypothetical protein BZL30_3255 [Mycobacterium kansasii]
MLSAKAFRGSQLRRVHVLPGPARTDGAIQVGDDDSTPDRADG